MEGLLDVIQEIALPETQPSLGGGSSNNDLPRKKGFPLAMASSREATTGYGKKAPESRRSRMSSCQ